MAELLKIFSFCFGSSMSSSFKARLFAGMTAVILVVSTGFASLLFYQQYKSQQDKLSNEGALMARLLAREVRLAVFSGNRDQVMAAAQGIMSFPDIQFIEVYDHDGLLLTRLSRPVEESSRYSMFEAKIPGLLNRQMEESLLVGKSWNKHSEGGIGTVKISIDRSAADRKFLKLIMVAFLATSVFLALGIMAAYLLAGTMARPLSQLSAAAAAIGEGDDNVLVKIETSDEIGQLAASFNSMAKAVRDRKLELEHALEELYNLNVSLEEKVSSRTAQLESANRELESFNYSASHDLRAPLNRLSGFCDALREEYGDQLDEQGRTYLDRIAAVGDQMNRILSAMLTLYQVQQREMSWRRLNLSELVQAVSATLRETDRSREVAFVIQEGVFAYGDTKLLWLALENILGNAWKFTAGRTGAKIEFGMTEKNGEKTCFIKDNGAGFNMEYSDKLFTPFQRLHNHEDFPGTGVGLAIVHRIISRHGSRIWLESVEGMGTTCYFTLPSTPPDGYAAQEEVRV